MLMIAIFFACYGTLFVTMLVAHNMVSLADAGVDVSLVGILAGAENSSGVKFLLQILSLALLLMSAIFAWIAIENNGIFSSWGEFSAQLNLNIRSVFLSISGCVFLASIVFRISILYVMGKKYSPAETSVKCLVGSALGNSKSAVVVNWLLLFVSMISALCFIVVSSKTWWLEFERSFESLGDKHALGKEFHGTRPC